MTLLRLIFFAFLVYLGFRLFKQVMSSASGKQTEPPRPWTDSSSSEPSPFEILGVQSGASQEEIKSAYQKLVQQYHPDRVAGMGPEIRAVAERRTKEINAAYSRLKR